MSNVRATSSLYNIIQRSGHKSMEIMKLKAVARLYRMVAALNLQTLTIFKSNFSISNLLVRKICSHVHLCIHLFNCYLQVIYSFSLHTINVKLNYVILRPNLFLSVAATRFHISSIRVIFFIILIIICMIILKLFHCHHPDLHLIQTDYIY